MSVKMKEKWELISNEYLLLYLYEVNIFCGCIEHLTTTDWKFPCLKQTQHLNRTDAWKMKDRHNTGCTRFFGSIKFRSHVKYVLAGLSSEVIKISWQLPLSRKESIHLRYFPVFFLHSRLTGVVSQEVSQQLCVAMYHNTQHSIHFEIHFRNIWQRLSHFNLFWR